MQREQHMFQITRPKQEADRFLKRCSVVLQLFLVMQCKTFTDFTEKKSHHTSVPGLAKTH